MLSYRKEIKNTRKEHRCYDCKKIIPKGSKCTSGTTTNPEYTKTISTAYWCNICIKILDDIEED